MAQSTTMPMGGKPGTPAEQPAKDTPKPDAPAGNGVVQRISDTVSDLTEQGKQAIHRISEGASEAGEKVQKWAGEAYDSTSRTVSDYSHEVTELVRKYPMQSVLIGFGIGVLVSRAMRS